MPTLSCCEVLIDSFAQLHFEAMTVTLSVVAVLLLTSLAFNGQILPNAYDPAAGACINSKVRTLTPPTRGRRGGMVRNRGFSRAFGPLTTGRSRISIAITNIKSPSPG